MEIHNEELKAAWYAYNVDGEIKLFDVKPYFKFKAFEILKDIEKFNKVKISGLSVGWENDIDICPDELYELSK